MVDSYTDHAQPVLLLRLALARCRVNMIPQMKLYNSAASSLLTAAIFLAYLTDNTSGLTCHCLNGSSCDQSNGFCPSGCDMGWYGPGCQVGNLALGKNATQSSSLADGICAAGLAVDGLFPANNTESAISCSHTIPKGTNNYHGQNAWWSVELSQSEVFVLMNITIVNRQGPSGGRLGNFSILYTNGSSDPPNPINWTLCAYEANSLTGIVTRTYTCQSLAIGRRVAVYLNTDPNLASNDNILMLCEVHVYGYIVMGCQAGYYGPGCLLRKYDSSVCVNTPNTTRGDFDGCRFPVCPDKGFWPPDCWITMPSFANVSWKAEAVCDHISVSSQSLVSSGDLNATAIVLTVNACGSTATSIKQNFTYSQSGYLNVSIPAIANKTYFAWLTPQICLRDIGCPDGPAELCSGNADCVLGVSSFIHVVQTNVSRQYSIWQNGSCIFANVAVTSPTCELPVSLSLSCNKISAVSQQYTTATATLCGVSSGMNYDCTVYGVLINNYTEYFAAEVYIPVAPAVIAGSVAGVLVLVAIVGGSIVFLILRRRRKHSTGSHSASPTDSSTPYAPADKMEQIYDNVTGMSLSQFEWYIKDEDRIAARFAELNANQSHPCLCGKDPANKGKNRFQNILPYDANRVILNMDGGSYINASYIDGFIKSKKCIATQGPSPKTVDDFWRMVWQENTETIVMLTDYIEQSKKKCEKYFPKAATNGCSISVTVQSTTTFDTHTISTLIMQNIDEARVVNHYHLTAWRDQSVPEHCAEIVLFYCKIPALLKELAEQNGSPVIVHCSAGVGRTGAFLAFDYLQQRFRQESRIDVDFCVLKLRDQRMLMVQTTEQYVFVHRAALYAMKTLRFVFEAALLPAYIKRISRASGSTNPLNEEWQLLQQDFASITEFRFITASLKENALKNRDERILASDLKRPMLSGNLGAVGGYINAVYCNGCYAYKGFIATQLPLASTVNDFWQMVYECQASCIVLLHELPPEEDCPQYWPNSMEAMTTGLLVVTNVSLGRSGGDGEFREIDLTLSLSRKDLGTTEDSVIVKLYILNAWDWASEVPKEPKKLLSLARYLTGFCKISQTQPVIVQCRDGASHCGLFVSAINSLHRLMETSQVQVFHSVELARVSRQEFIRSQEQYRFIYEFLQCSTHE